MQMELGLQELSSFPLFLCHQNSNSTDCLIVGPLEIISVSLDESESYKVVDEESF